jgi:hypothetical protein
MYQYNRVGSSGNSHLKAFSCRMEWQWQKLGIGKAPDRVPADACQAADLFVLPTAAPAARLLRPALPACCPACEHMGAHESWCS